MPILLRDAGIEDSVAEFWKIWMNALRKTQPDLLAYLSYMVERLVWMKGLLRPAGSVWLHCDPEASHYIKVMMDGIFGHKNFRNEVIWKRTSSHSDSSTMGWVHDVLLLYTKGDKFTYNTEYVPYDKDYIDNRYRPDPDADGRLYTDGDLTAKGLTGGGYDYEYKGKRDMWRVPLETMQKLDKEKRLYFTRTGGIRVKRYLDELPGVPVSDLWADIPPVNSRANERLGYKTQKPLKLLKRIIAASSNEGDTVLDPFCGCATTLEAAHELGRKWIGIDIAIHAVKRVARLRLQDRLHLVDGKDFKVDGVPRNLEGAKDLWERDKYHFQKWAIEQVDGFVTTRRTADGGIDGRLYFGDVDRDLHSMVIEVKGGKNVSIANMRALHSVMVRDEAELAGMIIMEPLGSRKAKNFHNMIVEVGDLVIRGRQFARMQILSVPEILEGKRFDTPLPRGKTDLVQQQIGQF